MRMTVECLISNAELNEALRRVTAEERLREVSDE